ncbi:hypothetical protein [Saccharothrix algeriensis]|uniref:Uncharacterized protein n=1 Tax=Saccharothrix algeriensis TaxID=173560 RepID=A0ABS2S2M9_9PSEU|nr:hypothetical protein [Saccharothrix algeriensis]MBM7810487.1 hypothetical protein [Saccharothrix algeriensis]
MIARRDDGWHEQWAGLVDVRRNRVRSDMSNLIFTALDGMLVPGLATGPVRAFGAATSTVDR